MNARSAGPAREVGLPAVDDRDEAREREDPGRRRAVGAQAERVAHHRAHREAAEHRPLRRDAGALPQLVVEGGELRVGGVEGVGVGIADARHDVPVVAGPARQRQRRARRDDVQPPLRVEHVAERRAGRARRRRGRGGGRAGRRARRRPGARGRSARSWPALCQLGSAAHGRPRAIAGHHERVSLFWRVFAINAAVLVAAAVALAVSPATVSSRIRLGEVVVLAVGVAVVLAVNLLADAARVRPARAPDRADAPRRPARAGQRIEIERPRPRSRRSARRSTTCSTGSSASGATARGARSTRRRRSGGGWRASCTTRSARR